MELNYPELKDRIQSTFIDTLFMVFLLFVAAAVLDKYGEVPDWVRMALFAGIFLAYEPLSMTFGCTLGNYLKGIRVRRQADPEKRIHLFQAIIRYPVKFFLGWLSFLTIHMNPQRRALHDLVSGTVMIKL